MVCFISQRAGCRVEWESFFFIHFGKYILYTSMYDIILDLLEYDIPIFILPPTVYTSIAIIHNVCTRLAGWIMNVFFLVVFGTVSGTSTCTLLLHYTI